MTDVEDGPCARLRIAGDVSFEAHKSPAATTALFTWLFLLWVMEKLGKDGPANPRLRKATLAFGYVQFFVVWAALAYSVYLGWL